MIVFRSQTLPFYLKYQDPTFWLRYSWLSNQHNYPCLQNPLTMSNQTHNSTKINIISNVIIKKASWLPLQSQQKPELSCSFKYLVLRKIQQDNKDTFLTKKKRVAKGAEIITATMGAKILKEMEHMKIPWVNKSNKIIRNRQQKYTKRWVYKKTWAFI